jgi:hypothetical protein
VVRKAVGDPDGLTVSVRAALGSYDGRRRAEKFQLILDSIRSFEFGRFGELLLARAKERWPELLTALQGTPGTPSASRSCCVLRQLLALRWMITTLQGRHPWGMPASTATPLHVET